MWFSTHSLRRKMAFGGVLLAATLLVMAGLGYYGLSMYRDAQKSVEFGLLEIPRRADLDAAVGRLFQPLVAEPVDVDPRIDAKHRARAFAGRLDETRERVRGYFAQFEGLELHQSELIAGQRPVLARAATRIEAHFDELERLNASVPHHVTPGVPLTRMLAVAGSLIDTVQGVPDTRANLRELIVHVSENAAKLQFWVFGALIMLSVLLVWESAFLYRKIFGPLRELHGAVTRVANGDYDHVVPVRDRDEIGELAGAFNDMTARFRETRDGLDRQVRERSRQLVRSERLAGLGTLSAGVAHEINNPLQSIVFAAEAGERKVGRLPETLGEEDRDWLVRKWGMIRREADACQKITRRLLSFARGTGTDRDERDLVALLGEVLEMVVHMPKFRDREVVFAARKPVVAEVNAGEIKQVMLNLVSNALAATDEGGRLEIDVAATTDAVVLAFRDDGCGMSEETRTHLFEPFYTKQRDGRGTGLGMSISHRIVTDHGGTIEADSEGPGRGSVFTVTLPRRAERVAAAA